nr:hypothetical protein [Nocardia transvalensis]
MVAVAFVVPRIRGEHYRDLIYAAAAPIFGGWLPHVGWGTGPAVAVAVLVVGLGPVAVRRLPWGRLLLVTWVTAMAWTFSLAMIDGWQRGFAGRLTTWHEYLHEVGGVGDIGVMLRGFSDRILDFQPDSWTTHTSGHPPGALLVFVWLDRIGLGGGAWAGAACVVVGCSAAVAVPIALKALGAPDRARAVTPFLALAPAAIWIGVSADALFAGVTAWAVALLAVATRRGTGWPVVALVSGSLFGFGLYLNYGLVLMVIPAAAVLLARGLRPALPALIGVALVVAAFTASGFWWLDGYHLVIERYYQGIASVRPYSYWVWGNLAATVCAVGLATVAAGHRVARGLGLGRMIREGPATGNDAGPVKIRRALSVYLERWRAVVDPAALLATAGLAAIVAADLSGLSKAETERIWLPFDMWLLAATALLPPRSVRWWLAAQAVAALLLNHLLLTSW